jgi:hypothetical protein
MIGVVDRLLDVLKKGPKKVGIAIDMDRQPRLLLSSPLSPAVSSGHCGLLGQHPNLNLRVLTFTVRFTRADEPVPVPFSLGYPRVSFLWVIVSLMILTQI